MVFLIHTLAKRHFKDIVNENGNFFSLSFFPIVKRLVLTAFNPFVSNLEAYILISAVHSPFFLSSKLVSGLYALLSH